MTASDLALEICGLATHLAETALEATVGRGLPGDRQVAELLVTKALALLDAVVEMEHLAQRDYG